MDINKVLKGRITEIIVEEMFKELGFFILQLGKEKTVNPLTQLQRFIKECKGNFNLEKLNGEIKGVTSINVLPDFAITHNSGKTELLEVKFRWNGRLSDKDDLVFQIYPEAYMLVANTEVDDKIVDEAEEGILPELKETRFHIWSNPNPNNLEETNVTTLVDFLEQEFGIKNREVIEKYEKILVEWLREGEELKGVAEKGEIKLKK